MRRYLHGMGDGMQYAQRPGIVRTKVCEAYLLIPSRQAMPECNQIRKMNLLWISTWDALEKKLPFETVVKAHMGLTGRSEQECIQRIEHFYQELFEDGFLIEVPEL